MGRKSLRTGDLVSALDRGAALFDSPEGLLTVGEFTFGVFMAQRRGPRPFTRGEEEETYVFVLDSRSCRFGWCLARLIRRPK